MIKIKVFNLKFGEIVGFQICGHAGYDEFGKDIICSAVSSAAYMTLNTVTELLKINCDAVVDQNSGYMKFKINHEDAQMCRVIFEGLKLHLIMLEEAYPKNISVDYEEVR